MFITLTTDFGTADGYVGAMKGVIARRAPGAVVVDITHEIARHDIGAAAYALAVAAPEFPPSAIHVAVVDPGVGSARRPVVACAGGRCFVAPDNGVLHLAVPAAEEVYEITAPGFRREPVSATFHGRDIFAPAAAALAVGNPVSAAGPAVELVGMLLHDERAVIHVDRFGNLITDIPGGELGEATRVTIAGIAVAPAANYAAVACGELLAYVGSSGTVEIAAREDSAAAMLGVGRGTPIEVSDA